MGHGRFIGALTEFVWLCGRPRRGVQDSGERGTVASADGEDVQCPVSRQWRLHKLWRKLAAPRSAQRDRHGITSNG